MHDDPEQIPGEGLAPHAEGTPGERNLEDHTGPGGANLEDHKLGGANLEDHGFIRGLSKHLSRFVGKLRRRPT